MQPTSHAGLTARTRCIDAVLADVPPDHERPVVAAIVDCAMSATTAACRSREPLVDFEEFLGRAAL